MAQNPTNPEAEKFLADIEALLARGADVSEDRQSSSDTEKLLADMDEIQPAGTPESRRRRGRPSTIPIWERPIRELSPRQLGRNDLFEAAQNWDRDLARSRAMRIVGRSVVAARAQVETDPSYVRRRRISQLASYLQSSDGARVFHLSSSNLAGRLAALFPEVNRETLRKDIAKAKKLARLTQ